MPNSGPPHAPCRVAATVARHGEAESCGSTLVVDGTKDFEHELVGHESEEGEGGAAAAHAHGLQQRQQRSSSSQTQQRQQFTGSAVRGWRGTSSNSTAQLKQGQQVAFAGAALVG